MYKYNITKCYYQDKFLIIISKYHRHKYIHYFISIKIQAIPVGPYYCRCFLPFFNHHKQKHLTS